MYCWGFFSMVLFVGCEGGCDQASGRDVGRKCALKRACSIPLPVFISARSSLLHRRPAWLLLYGPRRMSAARSSFALLTITAMYQLALLTYGAVMGAAKFSYLMGLPLALKLLICFWDSGKRDFRGVYPADSVFAGRLWSGWYTELSAC